jgi:hypothetical protein
VATCLLILGSNGFKLADETVALCHRSIFFYLFILLILLLFLLLLLLLFSCSFMLIEVNRVMMLKQIPPQLVTVIMVNKVNRVMMLR